MDNYASLICQANIHNESLIRGLVSLFIAPLNPTMDELTEVKTIISEAVANAIIHGYVSNDKGKVYVELYLDGKQLTIVVKDEGCGIEDLTRARQPLFTTKPELERSGMGMTIMESLSDEFSVVSKVNQGTTITMVKRLRGA